MRSPKDLFPPLCITAGRQSWQVVRMKSTWVVERQWRQFIQSWWRRPNGEDEAPSTWWRGTSPKSPRWDKPQCFTNVGFIKKKVICSHIASGRIDLLWRCSREALSALSNNDPPVLRVAVPCRPACRRNTSSAWPSSRRRCGPSVTPPGTWRQRWSGPLSRPGPSSRAWLSAGRWSGGFLRLVCPLC